MQCQTIFAALGLTETEAGSGARDSCKGREIQVLSEHGLLKPPNDRSKFDLTNAPTRIVLMLEWASS